MSDTATASTHADPSDRHPSDRHPSERDRSRPTSPRTALAWSTPLAGLPLLEVSPAAWAPAALARIDELLVDHAHCEQKAASAALALIGRYADRPGLIRPMLALAHEELRHYRQVVDLIQHRGGRLTPPAPDFYVKELRHRAAREPRGLGSYADLLLVNAFVEARSCERFRRLTEALGNDDALGAFYRHLAGAEGRHWETFRDLACAAVDAVQVDRRIAQFAALEADILRCRPIVPRMH